VLVAISRKSPFVDTTRIALPELLHPYLVETPNVFPSGVNFLQFKKYTAEQNVLTRVYDQKEKIRVYAQSTPPRES
jgi:hypothetical protein